VRVPVSARARASAYTSCVFSGVNFGQVDATASAAVGAIGCGTLSWTTGTVLTCYQGPSMGDTAVHVAVAGSVGTANAIFSFDGAQASLLASNVTADRGLRVPPQACWACSSCADQCVDLQYPSLR
jgi:hypothetical protein